MKKSLPQLKRVRITLHLKFCALLIQQNIPPNYLKKQKQQILKMGSKETTSMFQQGRGMNWTVKKTTLIISKKKKNNHTILSTYQELIKQERQKTNTKKTYHHYTCTELHTCFETFVMIIILHSVLQLLYLLIIVIILKKENYLHHRNYEILKNNWSPITTTNIRTYHKFISINFCQKSFIYK